MAGLSHLLAFGDRRRLVSSVPLGARLVYGGTGTRSSRELHVDGFVWLFVSWLEIEIYHMYGDYGTDLGLAGVWCLVTHIHKNDGFGPGQLIPV